MKNKEQVAAFRRRVSCNGLNSHDQIQIGIELNKLGIAEIMLPEPGHDQEWLGGFHAAQKELVTDTVLPLLERIRELEEKLNAPH